MQNARLRRHDYMWEEMTTKRNVGKMYFGLTSNKTNWTGASQVPEMVKNPPVSAGDMRLRFDPWVGKIP